ncbi:MAG TPA: DUF305 domain-containing protein [Chloroflexota bacterium]|nr:DUF305 domain-containing protein [Chloroflexota bacterium]
MLLAGDPQRRFIEEMVPHHEDAVAMADLALTRAEHPELTALATAIKATQTEEIDQMRAWYRAWFGADVPPGHMGAGRGFAGRGPTGMTGMMGGPTGPMGMTGGPIGMMGRQDPAALAQAQPFDKAFIEQMAPHHQMAVMLSAMALPGAQRPELIALLQSIVAGQSAEIRQMRAWFEAWYG